MKTGVVLQYAREALSAIEGEIRAVDAGERVLDVGQSRPQLLFFRSELAEMIAVLESSTTLSPRDMRIAGSMGRIVGDSWPLGTELGTLVLRADQAYQKWVKHNRRTRAN